MKDESLSLESLQGFEAKKLLGPLASLRIEIFRDFPYLYEGSLDYEKKYLDRYFSSSKSLVVVLRDKENVVGVSTAIHLLEEEAMIREPVSKIYDPKHFVYFGESLLRKSYRGLGYGKKFFEIRENFARSLNAKWAGFCAVIRDADDPRKDTDYKSPEFLWTKLGYKKVPQLTTQISWKESGETTESPKKLQFWTNSL